MSCSDALPDLSSVQKLTLIIMLQLAECETLLYSNLGFNFNAAFCRGFLKSYKYLYILTAYTKHFCFFFHAYFQSVSLTMRGLLLRVAKIPFMSKIRASIETQFMGLQKLIHMGSITLP
jgi:hypothetical protein